MKKYSRVFKYLREYKSRIGLYFLFIFLSVIFSIVSVGMLMPFLDLIFKGNTGASELIKSTGNPVLRYVRDMLVDLMNKEIL